MSKQQIIASAYVDEDYELNTPWADFEDTSNKSHSLFFASIAPNSADTTSPSDKCNFGYLRSEAAEVCLTHSCNPGRHGDICTHVYLDLLHQVIERS